MKKIKWENKILAGLSGLCLAATALAISANTTAFAATSEEPLSPDNGYEVVVDLSATDPAYVGLKDVPAGGYILTVTPWYTEPGVIPAFAAKLNDSGDFVNLDTNEYMYGAYFAGFDISATSTQFEITTTLTETTTVTVMLYERVTPVDLPTDAAHPVTLARYEVYNYQYDFEGESGYYTINPHMPEGVGGLDVTLKTNPDYFYGTPVFDATYPVYLVKGTTYYFTVQYNGDPMSTIDSVDVYFSIDAWTAPTIVQDRTFYTLVSPNEDTKTENKVSLAADDYVLRIVQGPEAAYTSHITVHVVDSDNNETKVAIVNNECTIKVTETTRNIYFTSDSKTEFVIGAYVSVAPSPSVNFKVGTMADVSLKANETISCFVVDVTEVGNYTITLSEIKSGETALETSPIVVSDMFDFVIPEGSTTGMFPIVLAYPNEYGYPGETSTNATLTFTNYSDAGIQFKVLVEKSEGNYDVALNVATELTAQPGSRVTYFVPHITSGGTYRMSLTDASGNIVIYDYFNRAEPLVDRVLPQNLYSFGNIVPEEGQTIDFTYAFVVENHGETPEIFTVEFSKVNSLVLGEEETITLMTGTQNYYIGNLSNGRYQVELSDISEGATVSVRYNNSVIASNSNTTGYFTVEVPQGRREAIAMLTILSNSNASLKIKVTEIADGDMTLGTAQTVTLGYNDQSETYNIALEAGSYTLTLSEVPENVTIFVYVNGEYVEVVNNVATFTVTTAETVAVQFSYFYYGEDYTMSFSFTATITVATAEA